MSKPRFEDYDFIVQPLKPEDGGGYLITFPDLPGCMSDGETADEAVTNGREAFAAWVDACIAEGRTVPAPGESRNEPVRFVQRLPRYQHEQLVAAAEEQGVSVNALVLSFVAEGLARIEASATRAQNPIQGGSQTEAVTIREIISEGVSTNLSSTESVSSGAEPKPRVFRIEAEPPRDRSRYS